MLMPICIDNGGLDVAIKAINPAPTPPLIPYKKLVRKQGILETSRPKKFNP